MKKLNYLLLFAIGIVLISCGGKNSEKKGTEIEAKEASASDCLIKDLDGLKSGKNIVKKGSKDLFSGVAVEKDQFDSIITKVEIKNGWRIKEITRKRINEKYILDSEFNYENGEVKDKFAIEFEDFCCNDKINKFTYVQKYSPTHYEYDQNYYTVRAQTSTNAEGACQVDFTCSDKNTPKFLKDFNKNGGSNMDGTQAYIITDISSEKMYQILDAMKKELPHFNYWKNK